MTDTPGPAEEQEPASAGAAPVVVDARGLRCPLPVIRLAQVAQDSPAGTVLEVWATDPAAGADIPAWCRMRAQDYLGEVATDGGHAAYRVRTVG
ncbi:sulfurtransferase TusA family protein [Pedococcus bigeumensis]|uniref:sulfurtransferase TusA family protein n=1 Tax=Pedococcus bigeumensis TaxID=433644 RepID=UPI002FEA8933